MSVGQRSNLFSYVGETGHECLLFQSLMIQGKKEYLYTSRDAVGDSIHELPLVRASPDIR